MQKASNRSVSTDKESRLSQSDVFLFVSAVLEVPPICKDPKIASRLSVPASIRPHDSVRSAAGMRRQALRLRLDAYHSNVSSDWMLIITISCCWLMTFTVSAAGCHRGARRQRLDFPWYFPHKVFHTFRLLLQTCLLCPERSYQVWRKGFAAASRRGHLTGKKIQNNKQMLEWSLNVLLLYFCWGRPVWSQKDEAEVWNKPALKVL